MSEYRFTGPFYNDNEDVGYERVTPPPAETYAEPALGFQEERRQELIRTESIFYWQFWKNV